eukprot:TRINITY_DN94507_c0_g1_i1.p1 TRINITY_DN94507_c0_g1~~TRINITY_DN94507_c0_g1_i1.p1  ORF type:complete len:471 (-),score=30.26 TRINITY_DN94507_c0_g1_i1:116-1528(-)
MVLNWFQNWSFHSLWSRKFRWACMLIVGSYALCSLLVKKRRLSAPKVTWQYRWLCQLLEKQRAVPPCLLIDMDAFDHNLAILAACAKKANKFLRLGTKSVRVPALIEYALQNAPKAFDGRLLTFSVHETDFLFETLTPGIISSALVAYPTAHKPSVELAFTMRQQNKNIVLMVDCEEHIDILAQVWDEQAGDSAAPFHVCIDMDVSLRLFGDRLHLGVNRSPIKSLESFRKLFRYIAKFPQQVKLVAVMGYEAQISGTPDALSLPIQLLQSYSSRDVANQRLEVAKFCKSEGVDLEFFNGGGSGSVDLSLGETALTEVAVGSGLFQSHIFDNFTTLRRLRFKPAIVYALECCRHATKDIVVCRHGGYLGSGHPSLAISPQAVLPEGLQPNGFEGFGEVQSPLTRTKPYTEASAPRIGQPVFVRPAKAGEATERFNVCMLFRKGKDGMGYTLVDEPAPTVPSYRGLGQCWG